MAGYLFVYGTLRWGREIPLRRGSKRFYAYTGPIEGATYILEGDYIAWVCQTGRVSDWSLIRSGESN